MPEGDYVALSDYQIFSKVLRLPGQGTKQPACPGIITQLKGIGRKFDRDFDVVYMQRILTTGD